MDRRAWGVAVLVGVLAVAAAAPASGASATSPGAPSASDRSVIVLLEPGVDPARVAAEHRRAHGVDTSFVYDAAVRGYAAEASPGEIDELRDDPDVKSVVPDGVTRLEVTDPAVAPQQAQAVPTGVARVRAPDSPTADIDGSDNRIDVDIAVVDSGIQSDHPDLNVAGGVDCVDDPADPDTPDDQHGHGTMVGGLAGAVDNEIGHVGVAPGARLWSVRVATAGGLIHASSLLCGMDWVVENADTIEVANLSLIGVPTDPEPPSESTDCDQANPTLEVRIVCATTDAGVVVVAAAGNGAVDAQTVSPARIGPVITVSALADSDGRAGGVGPAFECLPAERDDTFAYFSNFGSVIDLIAPGVCISSTYKGSSYATASGTSFSAPLVAGAAGLYLSQNPEATPAEVRDALVDAARPGPVPEDPDSFAEGLLDVSTF